MAALAAILLLSSAAQAGVAEELTAAINKCAAIADDATRHACYDQLPSVEKSLAPVAAAEASSRAAAQAKAPPPAGETSPQADDFNLFASEPVPADHISATVVSFTADYGLFIVTLDNGQVWKQVADVGALVHFSKEKKDHVTIWRNRFGEYVLKIEGFHPRYHVRRLK